MDVRRPVIAREMRARTVETVLICGVSAFLVAAAWWFAGLRSRDLPVFAAAALALLGVAWVGAWRHAVAGPWRDVFFWFGFAFLVYLGIQWWNAGRIVYYDVEFRHWAATPPRHSGWPSAFSREEALQMLGWFFPAWVLGMVMRSPLLTGRGLMRCVYAIVGSAALLALYGLIRYLAKATSLYGGRRLGCHVFASFAYANHAAAYFMLLGAVIAGLLFHRVLRRRGTGSRLITIALGGALALCFCGANLSLSRTGVILSWGLALLVAIYGLTHGWRSLQPGARFNRVAVTIMALGSLYFAVTACGGAAIRREFAVERAPEHPLIPALTWINLDLTVHPLLWRAGWDMLTEHPLYGVGGWGYRYLVALHVPPDRIEHVRRQPGWANVHNDPLQFLVEFGIVGAGLMALAWGSLVVPLCRRGPDRKAVLAMTCLGLAAVLVFSLIDLPFRCPAILWTWVALLAALPGMAGPRHTLPVDGLRETLR